MKRRLFIKNTCGACGLLALAGSAMLSSCGTASGISVYKATAINGKVAVPIAAFTQSGVKLIRVKDAAYDVALTRSQEGAFTALLLKCTHAGQMLTKTGSTYYCALHGSRFDQDGKVLKGPASIPLQHLSVTTDDQHIWIMIHPSANS